MSILTDCYIFKKIATKSKTRLDCVASTESYPEFEEKRSTRQTRETEKRDGLAIGDLIVYFGDVPEVFGGSVHRKADKSLTIKGKNLSSIFVPDPSNNYAYGDVRGTADALIFVFRGFDLVNGEIKKGASLQVFVARGKSKDRIPLYNLLCDGALDDEMQDLRDKAIDIQERKEMAVTKSVTLTGQQNEGER